MLTRNVRKFPVLGRGFKPVALLRCLFWNRPGQLFSSQECDRKRGWMWEEHSSLHDQQLAKRGSQGRLIPPLSPPTVKRVVIGQQ